MAVQQLPGEASTSSSMSISTSEPTATIEGSRKRIHSEIIDLDVDENTGNTPTTSDSFPKYVDCQETLVEMSFIKWLAGFRFECRKISYHTNTDFYFGLFNFFCLNIASEMIDCRNKMNKSTLIKSYLEQTIMFFRRYYKTVKKDKGDTLDVIYYDRMSSMLAYHIDLILMSSQRYKENSSHKKTSCKINTMLFVFLDQKFDYMFDSVFQLYYVFYGSVSMNLEPIMLPIFKKLLSEHQIPKNINFLTYMRYILCFKLWKKIIHSSTDMADSVKRKEVGKLRLLVRGLNVPNDFISQHENYNWPNWPKLTISPNGTPDSIQRDLKNVSLVLYSANLSLKECYKDILDASRKDIPILLKPIEEQCKILRPDLFAISGKEVLKNWNENFDDTLKPLLPTTRSCNSSMRKIKFNVYIPSMYECLEIDDETDEVRVVQINDDLSKLKDLGEGSGNHSLRNKEIFSHSDTICIENTNKTIIDESNNDKSNENEKSPVDALQTSTATLESFPVNLKPQLSEDEMQVSVKKSKSSEKQNMDDGRFDPTLSYNLSRLNYISDITSTSHHPECSYSKGSKRNQCSSFDENSKNKKMCRTKSKHENNVSNCNPNQIIDSNCQNSNIDNSSCGTLDNDNSVLINNTLINGVSCLINESSVKKNKWATKASNNELLITAVLNLKHTQSNCTVSDKDRSTDNCTEIIDLCSDEDGIASPSSDTQWPTKLIHSDPSHSPEPKPIINNSEQIEIEPPSSDTEGINSPKIEHLLSLRNSEEMISKLVSSDNCTEIIDLCSDEDGTASPSSGRQWPTKLIHSDPSHSPKPKPIINNSEQIEIEPPSSDTEGNNSPKIEHLLSLRNSEEMISKLVSSDNCTEIIDLCSDEDGTASPSSGRQWPTKLIHSDPSHSPEPKPIINNSEQIEIEPTSSDTESNNNPKTEHLLSLRNSEEMISKLVSSSRSINENENTQIYALPMDKKLSPGDHPYVENAIDSNTQDLEVVNVLSPVSINSTDISMNKNSQVSDKSLVHNNHDIDCDNTQSLQQLNGLFNSINISTSRNTK